MEVRGSKQEIAKELFAGLRKDLLKRFKEFHSDHRFVFDEFKRSAILVRDTGRPTYSPEIIVSKICWDYDITRTGAALSVPVEFCDVYARLLCYHEPTFIGYFDIKQPSTRRCPYCDAKLVEYKHNLSEALVTGLSKLYETGGKVNLKELGLTRNQWDNFQKLRYWDLVKKSVDEDGKRLSGVWEILPAGVEFLQGKRSVQKWVWTYRGERVRFEGDTVAVHDVLDGYKAREDYAHEAKHHE